MDEFWSFAGVVALWLGVSCGLWWLHRRSLHARQRRQMRQAVRAVAYVADGQTIFDAIRRLPPAARNATGATLTAETHALLKRIQDRAAYFDKVNVLRIDMLAAFGIEDHPPLSEILHIRRDLWAASEIVLVEDLGSFGESFTEEGAYERFRAEAVALLFKLDGATSSEEDLIDLRLSLARGEAERLVPELKDAIRLARERDRLPTFAEIIAYPVGAIRAVPGKLRIARAFLSEFYGYAAEIAGAIRRSEAMERGVSELRRAREELPQRLVTGFERASDAARQSATGLRRHYDFLVAAHDFQAKYEHALRRGPQITERGRQFIARLELAERSERLRLTSANVLIWLARQLATGLAYFIAGLQQLHAVLSETPPGVLAAALVAPTPMRGRHVPAFRSYRMALGMSGLTEPRTILPVTAERIATPMTRKSTAKAGAATAPSEQKSKRAKAPTKAPKTALAAKMVKLKEPANPVAVAPRPDKGGKRDKPVATVVPVSDATATRPVPVPSSWSKTSGGKAAAKVGAHASPEQIASEPTAPPTPAEASEASPDVAPPAAKLSAGKRTRTNGRREAKPADMMPSQQPAAPSGAAAMPTTQHDAAPPEPVTRKTEAPPPANAQLDEARSAIFPPEKRRSFLDRLLGRRPPEPTIGELLAAAWEREHAHEAVDAVADATPPETVPTLLAKLAELPAEELPEDIEDESDGQDEPIEEADAEDESGDDPESLTSSVLEVQAKLAPRPQIRSFPWLRG